MAKIRKMERIELQRGKREKKLEKKRKHLIQFCLTFLSRKVFLLNMTFLK
jgi:hypothetical protein